jgi:hypothetical protein
MKQRRLKKSVFSEGAGNSLEQNCGEKWSEKARPPGMAAYTQNNSWHQEKTTVPF